MLNVEAKFLMLVLFLAAAAAQGPAAGPEDKRAENTLVRVNITVRSEAVRDTVEVNGRRVTDYRPEVVRIFPATGIVMDDKSNILTFLGYAWVDIHATDPSVDVVDSTGRRHSGTLIGIDQSTGVAVVSSPGAALKRTPICGSCEIRNGTTVVRPVVRGSAISRFESAKIVSVADGAAAASQEVWVVTMNQSLPGIGEPLLDTQHRVLGFVAGERPSPEDPMGLRTVVYPMSQLLASASRILKNGSDIRTGWLGVYLGDSAPAAGPGIAIREVLPGSPAQKAGLLPADVIVHWNGKAINGVRHFIRTVQETPIGSRIALGVIRNGVPLKMSASIEARKPEKPGRFSLNLPVVDGQPVFAEAGVARREAYFGLETTPLTPQLADVLQLSGQTGLLVLKADRGTPFGDAGIAAGDVITAVNGNRVDDPRGLSSEIQGGTDGRLVLSLIRKGVEREVRVPLPAAPRKP